MRKRVSILFIALFLIVIGTGYSHGEEISPHYEQKVLTFSVGDSVISVLRINSGTEPDIVVAVIVPSRYVVGKVEKITDKGIYVNWGKVTGIADPSRLAKITKKPTEVPEK